MSFDVRDKVVLITGANRGIGRAIADACLLAGVKKLYAAVRNPSSVGELVAEQAGRVVPLALDLQDAVSVEAAAKNAADVELVINNAGVLQGAELLSDAIFEALDVEIDVNVKGLLRIAKAFAPTLKENRGALVQINSVASLRNFADFASYCASKAAAYSLTQALRDKLQPEGIYVVSVHPGPIATDMAHTAGLTEIAEPASVVADALLSGLRRGDFHIFPDTMARGFWEQYTSFASAIVEN